MIAGDFPAAVIIAPLVALLGGVGVAFINARSQVRTVATQKSSTDATTVINGWEKLNLALERQIADLRHEVAEANERAERAELAAAEANRRLDAQLARHERELEGLHAELAELRSSRS